MNKMISSTAALAIAAVMSVSAAQARDQIQVAGSSTVLPYAKIVAETFGETFPNFKAPVVDLTTPDDLVAGHAEGVYRVLRRVA